VALLQKEIRNLRHAMGLRHPVIIHLKGIITRKFIDCAHRLFDATHCSKLQRTTARCNTLQRQFIDCVHCLFNVTHVNELRHTFIWNPWKEGQGNHSSETYERRQFIDASQHCFFSYFQMNVWNNYFTLFWWVSNEFVTWLIHICEITLS